jgi:phosphatidate cytidylyltransferase
LALSSLGTLAQRVITAAVLGALVLVALLLLPTRGWAILTLVIVVMAAQEWAKLVGYERWNAILFVAGTLVIGLNLLFSPAVGFDDDGWPDGIVLAVCGPATLFWVVVAPVWFARGWRTDHKLALAIVGWIVLLGVWVAIVELHAHSPWLVLAGMALVWVADTAAYFSGRRFGRTKLAPSISPNKTWEGVYGGLAAVAVYALALVPFAAAAGFRGDMRPYALAAWLLFAVALAAVSVVGDLYESMLKRRAGVKDSGTLLPGHGGVLDRVDALLAAMPPAAIAATLALGVAPG